MNRLSLADISRRKSIRDTRPYSVLITPFTTQEWQLASAITTIMDHVSSYPDLPDFVPKTAGQKSSQLIVEKAADVICAVRKLSMACLESIKMSYLNKQGEEEYKFRDMKSSLHAVMVTTTDKIKENLLNGSLKDDITKQVILEYLIDIASLSSEMIDYVTELQQQAKKRNVLSFANFESSSEESSISSFQAVIPNGESFAVLYEVGGSRRPEHIQGDCLVCQKPIDEMQPLTVYLSKMYHQSCFKCVQCKNSIMQVDFLTKDEEPICSRCSPKCSTCMNPIISDCFLAFDQSYHQGCFKCVDCDQVIPNDASFFRKDGGAQCTSCILPKKRQTVFDSLWKPSMNTRFSVFLHNDEELAKLADLPRESKQLPALPLSPKPQHRDSNEVPPIPPPRLIRVQSPSRPSTPQPPKRKQSTTDLAGSLRRSVSLDQRPPTPPISKKSVPVVQLRSLPGVLSSESGIDSFVDFGVQDSSIEGIFFWMDVEQFRQLQDADQVGVYAQTIYDKYIGANAELKVDIEPDILRNLDDAIQTADTSIFDEAQACVYQELETVVLPKFLKSSFGKKYLQTALSQHAEETLGPRENVLPKIPSVEVIQKYPDYLLLLEIKQFEKRLKPEKHYVYQIAIRRVRDLFKREDQSNEMQEDPKQFCPVIYRSYQDFIDLHKALSRYFQQLRDRFPMLPHNSGTMTLFRSNPIKSSVNRSKELNEYLFNLFKMPTAVVQSLIIKEFLKPTKGDVEEFQFAQKLE